MKTEVQPNQGMEVLQIQSQNLSSLIEPFQVVSTSNEEINHPPHGGSRKKGLLKTKAGGRERGKYAF